MQLKVTPVTEEKRKDVETLSVFPHQKAYIEDVKECLQ